jgi:hypothetical protein
MNANSPANGRGRTQRRHDTIAKLRADAADVWVASAAAEDGTGIPYLVPVSLAWIDERAVIAIESTSRTAKNIAASRIARLGLGPTRDVVLIDAELERAVAVSQAPQALADGYAAQSDWDPRESPDGYRYIVLRPCASRHGEMSASLPGAR